MVARAIYSNVPVYRRVRSLSS